MFNKSYNKNLPEQLARAFIFFNKLCTLLFETKSPSRKDVFLLFPEVRNVLCYFGISFRSAQLSFAWDKF